jgi:hypothetical protein
MPNSRRDVQPIEIGANAPDLHGVYEKLGEITATLRDVSHTGRDNAAKIDALGGMVIKQGALHDHVAAQAAMREKHHERLNTLEVDMHHRQGAIGLMSWFSRHWPVTVLLADFAAVWAWATWKLG